MGRKSTEAHKERERIRRMKSEVEREIEAVSNWLMEHPVDHPDWDNKVSQLHALELRIENIGVPVRRDGFVWDNYRLMINI